MLKRLYTESEVADLIGRAVERQRDADAEAGGVGLTLAEVERIGAEAGIDPAHLRRAAADLAAGIPRASAAETDTHVMVERWVDASLTAEAWEDVVARLREARPLSDGAVRRVGTSHEWVQTSGEAVMLTATLSERNGRTRIRLRRLMGTTSPKIEGKIAGALVGLVTAVVVALVAAGIGASNALVALAAFVSYVAAGAASAPVVTRLSGRVRSRALATLDTLGDDLAEIVQDSASHARVRSVEAEDAATRRVAPRLDMDALGEPPDSLPGGSGRERARE